MNSDLVLIVDDEPSICWAFERMLSEDGYRAITASSAEEGLELARSKKPAVVVLDVRLPKQDGITALPKFLEATDNAPIILITAFGDLETAVAAVKRGASDYLTKPFKLEDARRACQRALEKSANREQPGKTKKPVGESSMLVGISPAMQQIFRQIALVADSDLSVLITGETGTGKELVAEAIHRHSSRAKFPYLAIAPVTHHRETIESELFGCVNNSPAGEDDERTGLFERAEKGTILLDEITEIPATVQVKLLRILEQGDYFRVGDTYPRTADVRILATTSSDLRVAVRDGKFRDDLFHRIAAARIELPPLRERAEDIKPLCEHFLATMNYPNYDQAIGAEVLARLSDRRWPGNVRELRNAVRHAAVFVRGRKLTIDDFPESDIGRHDEHVLVEGSLEKVVAEWTQLTLEKLGDQKETLHSEFLAAFEPPLLRKVLTHTGGNKAKAAEILGIHRGTLRDRLRAYGLDEE